jgi:hypothetical protein
MSNEGMEERPYPHRGGIFALEELGLLEELDVDYYPSLMKKQTSHFSRRSSDVQ